MLHRWILILPEGLNFNFVSMFWKPDFRPVALRPVSNGSYERASICAMCPTPAPSPKTLGNYSVNVDWVSSFSPETVSLMDPRSLAEYLLGAPTHTFQALSQKTSFSKGRLRFAHPKISSQANYFSPVISMSVFEPSLCDSSSDCAQRPFPAVDVERIYWVSPANAFSLVGASSIDSVPVMWLFSKEFFFQWLNIQQANIDCLLYPASSSPFPQCLFLQWIESASLSTCL